MSRLFEVNVEKTPEIEAKEFVGKLKSVGFMRVNKDFLANYMSKAGAGAAVNHIKSNYIKLVIEGKWSEREFADATYLIAKHKKIFSFKSYSLTGKSLHSNEMKDEILVERVKYGRRPR